jgi:hypothetical protein
MQEIDGYQILTVADEPDLAQRIQELVEVVWPRYVVEATIEGYSRYSPNWMGIFTRWPHFQFGLIDADGAVIGSGSMLTFHWSGKDDDLSDDGWDWLRHVAQQQFEAGQQPNTAAALGASILPTHQSKGLSSTILRVMRHLAQEAGLQRLVVPVRPNFKARYPIIPIEDYIQWTNGEGLPFDPWMRVHSRLGARLIKPCSRAMTMGGTVAQWETWTGVAIPGSGDFVLPDLLAPLHVDHAADRCIYVEPNVWMEHKI